MQRPRDRKGPAASKPTQREQGKKKWEPEPPKGKMFIWKLSDELGAAEISDGGQLLYNRSYLSKVLTDTPYGHWLGYHGNTDAETAEALAYLSTQVRPPPATRKRDPTVDPESVERERGALLSCDADRREPRHQCRD